jgi:hypothetical protein
MRLNSAVLKRPSRIGDSRMSLSAGPARIRIVHRSYRLVYRPILPPFSKLDGGKRPGPPREVLPSSGKSDLEGVSAHQHTKPPSTSVQKDAAWLDKRWPARPTRQRWPCGPSGCRPRTSLLVKFQQRYQMRHRNLRLEGSL